MQKFEARHQETTQKNRFPSGAALWCELQEGTSRDANHTSWLQSTDVKDHVDDDGSSSHVAKHSAAYAKSLKLNGEIGVREEFLHNFAEACAA